MVGEIDGGLVVLLGIARDDAAEGAKYLVEKICSLRIFNNAEGQMNLSVMDAGGELLVVSQFTLYGDVRRGVRRQHRMWPSRSMNSSSAKRGRAWGGSRREAFAG